MGIDTENSYSNPKTIVIINEQNKILFPRSFYSCSRKLYWFYKSFTALSHLNNHQIMGLPSVAVSICHHYILGLG